MSFAPKFPPFIAACSAASHTFNEKSFTQRVFLAKKVKNISEMEWNSFVCFTVDKENGREPAKQQRKGKNRTRRKLLLCFLSELLCLSFKKKYSLYVHPQNSTHLRSKSRAIMALDHSRLGLQNKFFPDKIHLRQQYFIRLTGRPRNINLCFKGRPV